MTLTKYGKVEFIALRRLLLSWTVLHIFPLLNFAIFYILSDYITHFLIQVFLGVTNIVLVGILAFFDFGYYRIFEAILYNSPEEVFNR